MKICVYVFVWHYFYYLFSIHPHHHYSLSVVSFVFVSLWQCNSRYNVRVIESNGDISNITSSNIITSNNYLWLWMWWYDIITVSKVSTANTPVANGSKHNDGRNGVGCSGSTQSHAVVSSSALFVLNISHSSSDITKWGGTR